MRLDGIKRGNKPIKAVKTNWRKLLPVNKIKPRRYRYWRRIFLIYSGIGALIFVIIFLGIYAFTSLPMRQFSLVAKLLKPGKYLILFQNNTELRPSGGFIGSFAIASFDGKKLTKLEVEKNIYTRENQFVKNNYFPQPEPFEKYWKGDSWALRNSNWDVDFARASEDIKFFYEKEYQQQIDGIIAINATLVKRLLKLTGPIKLPNYNLIIDFDNFLSAVQKEVEHDYYLRPNNKKINQPKTIIADLASVLEPKVLALDKRSLTGFILDALEIKEITLNFDDPKTQKAVEQAGWGNRLKRVNYQILAINNANLNGGKSSLGIWEKIDYRLNSKSRIVNLSILRENNGRQDGWDAGKNTNYTRVVLPKGTKLLSAREQGGDDLATSITQFDEGDYLSFGFWFDVGLGENKVINLQYRLPENVKLGKILLIKQSGAPSSEWSLQRDSGRLKRLKLWSDELVKL